MQHRLLGVVIATVVLTSAADARTPKRTRTARRKAGRSSALAKPEKRVDPGEQVRRKLSKLGVAVESTTANPPAEVSGLAMMATGSVLWGSVISSLFAPRYPTAIIVPRKFAKTAEGRRFIEAFKAQNGRGSPIGRVRQTGKLKRWLLREDIRLRFAPSHTGTALTQIGRALETAGSKAAEGKP